MHHGGRGHPAGPPTRVQAAGEEVSHTQSMFLHNASDTNLSARTHGVLGAHEAQLMHQATVNREARLGAEAVAVTHRTANPDEKLLETQSLIRDSVFE